MNHLNTIAILVVAYTAVFLEAQYRGLRLLLGSQIDLLPPLMVCTGLSTGIASVGVVATAGGLWFDSLSANPLGISILPLFIVGVAIHHWRDLILREKLHAQFVLGFAASTAVPLLTTLSLLARGTEPLLDWWSLWRWLVMAVGGAVATPVLCAFFGQVRRAFSYQPQATITFRPDREIKHGPRPHPDDLSQC